MGRGAPLPRSAVFAIRLLPMVASDAKDWNSVALVDNLEGCGAVRKEILKMPDS